MGNCNQRIIEMSNIAPGSVKRFHRKGFRGHVVGLKRPNGPTKPTNQTNHERVVDQRLRYKLSKTPGTPKDYRP